MKRKLSPDVLTAAAGLVVLAAVTLLRVSAPQAAPSFPSTFDTGRSGYAALYEFLTRERIAVRRFESPIGDVPERNVALVVAGDGALDAVAQSSQALAGLNVWVKSGNTLYIFGSTSPNARRALDIPVILDGTKPASQAQVACGVAPPLRGSIVDGDFSDGYRRGCFGDRAALLRARTFAPAVALRRGRGTLVLLTTPTVFDNWNLPRRDNARFALALFARVRAVAFDERPYGYAAGRSFWQVLAWPVRVAIAIALGALLLAIAGANIPFAPPYSQPAAGGRDSGAYIASLARLLLRAQANGEIVKRLAAQSETLLRTRLRPDGRSERLMQRAREFAALANPTPNDVLAVGELFAAVRKDYE